MIGLPIWPLLAEGADNIPYLQRATTFASRYYSQILLAVPCVLVLATPVPALGTISLMGLAAIVMAAKPAVSERSLCPLDFAVFAFFASSCASTAFAYDVTTALRQLTLRILFLLMYLASRWMEGLETALLPAFTVGMTIHCVEGLATFSRSYLTWSRLHFTSLIDFRSSVTLTPAGVRPGNHAAIYIVAIAAAIYALGSRRRVSRVGRYIYLSSLSLSLACVCLSFSRALYLCAVICLVISTWGMLCKIRLRTRAILAAIGGVTLALVAGFYCIRPIAAAAADTAFFAARLSQTRSISGRLSIFRAALHLASKPAWTGAGLDNFALAIRRENLLSPSLLTAHTFNVALQVAIEQGVLGIISLFFVIAGVIRMLWLHRREAECKALVGGATALLLFSMSQSFVFSDQAMAVALAISCALLASPNGEYD